MEKLSLITFQFRAIVAVEFVKKNSWPDLVPYLRTVIRGSDLIDRSGNSERKTVNALNVLHSLIRPFQVPEHALLFISSFLLFRVWKHATL